MGFLKTLKASLIATDVCVNAAALIIIPSKFFLEFCIKLTISPSILDCEKSANKPNSFDLFKQISFNSSNVVDPYCDCSLYLLKFDLCVYSTMVIGCLFEYYFLRLLF